MSSSLNLYVSSKGVDHGPLSLEEASNRVSKGDFNPDDLSWHQGVSGWIPLKQLPEWSQINKAPLPALTPSKDINNIGSEKKPSKTETKLKLNRQTNPKSATSFEEQSVTKSGMGFIGKLMVTFAITVFLATLGVVGYLIYQNLDKFIPQKVEATVSPTTPVEKDENTPESLPAKEIDPFAPPE